jgi:3-oxoacyl-[acyl-carrier-protein] synthase-3
MMAKLPLTILGSGMAVPAKRLLSATLDREIGKPEGWLYKRSGVHSRHVCESESQIDMGEAAARQALAEAGCACEDIGLVLSASAVPYQLIPSTAPLLQWRLGIRDGSCAAFDINSTCLSFLTALDIASRQTEPDRKALIVASELASRALPWADAPATAALFGDGAAAVVISVKGPGHIVASRMETYASAYEACALAAGGTRFDYHRDRENFDRHSLFHMDGEMLYRVAASHFEPFLNRLLAQAAWQREEVDLVVPHQASAGAMAHLARRCGFKAEIVVNIVADYGNQVAASLPTALHLARQGGRAKSGQKVLMLGTSAGVSLGGMAIIL